MYTTNNFKTKKALKEVVANGEKIGVYEPGAVFNGSGTVEGPHFPEPHKWYADVDLKDGVIVKVR